MSVVIQYIPLPQSAGQLHITCCKNTQYFFWPPCAIKMRPKAILKGTGAHHRPSVESSFFSIVPPLVVGFLSYRQMGCKTEPVLISLLLARSGMAAAMTHNGRRNNAVRANTSVVCEVFANARIALIPEFRDVRETNVCLRNKGEARAHSAHAHERSECARNVHQNNAALSQANNDSFIASKSFERPQ